tara:strand:- start:102 stop:320 length:219 start_codon:yes stop_codon:yes gene_type:complete
MATGSSFKLHKEYKRMIASSPPQLRSAMKKAFIQGAQANENRKNGRFVDPASAPKGGNRNNNSNNNNTSKES